MQHSCTHQVIVYVCVLRETFVGYRFFLGSTLWAFRMSDRVSEALSKFSKAKAKGAAAKPATDKQAQQKRNASNRELILAHAETPQIVRDKWNEILALPGQGSGKTKKKQVF